MAVLDKLDPTSDSATLVFSAQGDRYPYSCRVIAVTWRGSTTAGDQPRLRDLTARNKIIWEGQADGTNTYQGISYPWPGVDVKGGLEVDLLPAGQIVVALAFA